jgi:hypothetical protein
MESPLAETLPALETSTLLTRILGSFPAADPSA